MTTQILASNTTKTNKIKQLLELGFTRKQVAELMGVGYGFVQNVYAKHFSTQTNARGNTKFKPTIFNRQFGVEIEAYNVTNTKLKKELVKLGIRVEIERYNHTTKTHWKIITDSIPYRHSKLNTKSYVKYKTIEFRHHSGTVEFDKIQNWILFLHNLVEYSSDKRVSQVNFETLKTFNQPKVYAYLNNRKEELAA